MGRYCDHNFVCIKPLSTELKPDPLNTFTAVIEAPVPAVVACVYCGQIKYIDANGNVTIAVEEGKVIKKRNDQLNNTNQKI